jgi:hypothetical protein
MLRLLQLTAGPMSNATVTFGDGSSAQSFFSFHAGLSANMNYNYSAIGSYTVTATPVVSELSGISVSGNVTMTITVTAYPCNFHHSF